MLVPLTILLLLMMLTAWLNRTVERAVPHITRPLTHDPDYVVENFTMQRLSDLGRQHYLLTAKKLTHYNDDDTAHLVLPVFLDTQPGEPELRSRADRAIVLSRGDEARLYDHVEMFRPADRKPGSKAAEDLRISTSYLRLLPDDDHAETPARVVIENGPSVLIGTGMDYDNRFRQLNLRSAVTAHYVQTPK
jgi:lipopolysaccharide export system protein LptC